MSSQGDRKGTNSAITVYDLETGAYKKTIPFGSQALALASDEARDLLYVTDYGTGNVGVVDARTGTVVSQVSTGATSGANDVGRLTPWLEAPRLPPRSRPTTPSTLLPANTEPPAPNPRARITLTARLLPVSW